MTGRLHRGFAAALLLGLLSAAPAFGAGFAVEEMSAKAIGMSRAFTATADEASAVYYNPAAIPRLGTFELSGSTHLIDAHATHNTYERALGAENQKAKEQIQTIPALFATVAYDITDRIRVGWGAGVMVPFGLSIDWSKGNTWGGRFNVTSAHIQSVEYNLLTGSIEMDLSDDLSIALGQGNSLVTTEITLRRNQFVNQANTEVPLRLRLRTGEAHVDYRWSLGGMVRLFENNVRFGFAYRSDLNDVRLRGRIANEGDPSTEAFLRESSKAELTAKLPGELRLGVAVDLFAHRLTVELDYKFTNWSVVDSFELHSDNPDLPATEFEFRYHDTHYVALGSEYHVTTVADEGLGFAVRGGIYYDQSPVPTGAASPLLPDQDRYGFSVGVGLEPTENMTLDFGYMAVAFKRLKIEYDPTDPDEPTQGAGSYYSWANIFSFGAGFKF